MARPSWKKLVLLVPAGGLLVLVVVAGVAYARTDVPAASASSLQQRTIIQYVDGSELGRVGALNRRLVPLSQVSLAAREAVLAAEDRGFYSEPGISLRGIARALFTNLRGGGDVQQGGSTITQQYAKNAFLTSERTYTRKIKEVLISLKMTQTRSKDEILGDYLNTIYFGRGAYGIEAATETYFGGHAKDLSPAQAAVLASSIRSPSGYDPARHPQAAKARWAYVLDGMVKKGWLTPAQRAAATYPFVKAITKSSGQDRSGPKGYVIDRVEDELATDGLTEQRIDQGGLVVRTTLERKAQDAAVQAVEATVDPKQEVKADPACTKGKKVCLEEAARHLIHGALVAVRPGTGEVLAYYGGSAGNGGFDYASHASPQDPGSTMKPYVLATALEQGTSLRTRFPGYSPQEFAGYPRPVRNFGDEQFGRIDLTTATAHSVNTVYMQLAQQVGPAAIARTAHAAGIGEDVRLADASGNVGLGVALGIYGVPVIDQASGFSTFAARGVSAVPHMVLSVTEQGKREIARGQVKKHRAFSTDVADDATYAMQAVVRYGTASTNGQLAEGRPAAGKTGTTQESNDAWMVGFTPQVSAAVWIGRGDNQPIVDRLGVPGGLTGGTAPARVWKAFMDGALAGAPVVDFPPRAYVGSDAGSGGSVPSVPVAPPAQPSAPGPSPSASPSPTAVLTPSATPLQPSVPASSPPPSGTGASAPTPAATARAEGRSASPSPSR